VVAKFGVELFTSSPVPDGRQDKINTEARQAMAPLTGAAQDAEWNMIVPPEYQPPQRQSFDQHAHLESEPSARTTSPPQIDPPAHTRFDPGAHGVPVPGGTGDMDIRSTVTGGDGPILASGVITPLPPAPNPPPTVPTLPPSHDALPIAGAPISPIIGFSIPTGGPGSKPGSGAVLKPFGAGGAVKAMPPGGVIGGAPGEGIVNGTAASGGRRPNPVGGIIGQGGKATAGPVQGQAVAGGRRAARNAEQREGRTWDPDNPWAVEHGVAPVIHPDEEPKSFDAGPGVIGIDR
jgi:hypothetical protein